MTAPNGKPALAGGTPVRKDFLVFGAPDIRQPEIDEVVATLKSNWLGTGPRASEFEEKMSAYLGVEHCVALNSCTAALHLALLVAGIKVGDEVITTALTFCATVNAIIHAGGVPVLADVDRETRCIDPESLKRKITPETRCILPVHFSGMPCDMSAIRTIADENNLVVIQDAAHAIEAQWDNKSVARWGDITCLSFHATKNATTGEGGMLATDNAEYARKTRIYMQHGIDCDAWERFSSPGYTPYTVVLPGFKYNMTDIAASLGIHQLARVEENLCRRDEIWRRYVEAFADLPVELPPEAPSRGRHARHLFTLLVKPDEMSIDRDRLLLALKGENIGSGVHYPEFHRHPFYRETYGFQKGRCPHADRICERTFSLPFSPKLSRSEAEDVIHAVTKILKYYRQTHSV